MSVSAEADFANLQAHHYCRQRWPMGRLKRQSYELCAQNRASEISLMSWRSKSPGVVAIARISFAQPGIPCGRGSPATCCLVPILKYGAATEAGGIPALDNETAAGFAIDR